MKRQLLTIGLALAMTFSSATAAFAEENTVTMENSGAYLFEWRPVDCGNGRSFAILVGGNTISESDVILRRGYDYAYTFNPSQYARPWGQVPNLVNIDGLWGIPENEALLPAGAQPTLRITLVTNNKNLDTNERYVDVVALPGGVSTSSLPPEVRKYLINVDGSDAGAYDGTETTGWDQLEDGTWRYRKPDGTYVSSSWLNVDDESYYMDANGIMLADTITPDGYYVNSSGEKTNYMPGWMQVGEDWKYVSKTGYYTASAWVEDTDGKWYYFDMAGRMVKDALTPDGYYVDANGVWDGQPSSAHVDAPIGPWAMVENTANAAGWEQTQDGWKYRLEDGTYVTNAWYQTADGKWYYFNESAVMLADTVTPDGYTVDESGAWDESAVE